MSTPSFFAHWILKIESKSEKRHENAKTILRKMYNWVWCCFFTGGRKTAAPPQGSVIEAVIFSEGGLFGEGDSIAIKCFSPPFFFFFAGSSALWPGKPALPQIMCVTCLPSMIPSSRPALLSTLFLKWWSAPTRVSRPDLILRKWLARVSNI